MFVIPSHWLSFSTLSSVQYLAIAQSPTSVTSLHLVRSRERTSGAMEQTSWTAALVMGWPVSRECWWRSMDRLMVQSFSSVKLRRRDRKAFLAFGESRSKTLP